MPTFLHHAAEIAAAPYTSGVRWSGLSDDLDRRPSLAEQREATTPTAAERAVFATSPRGRFIEALNELAPVYSAETSVARACWSRNFSDDRAPVNPSEVSCAIRALVGINHPDARAAVSALAELLQAKAA